MSYTNIPGAAAPLLRGGSLAAIASTVAVIVSAGLLAAIYHLAIEESRNLVNQTRGRIRYRAVRHDAVLVQLLGSSIDPYWQERLLLSRDAYQTGFRILAHPELTLEAREIVRQALYKALVIKPQ